MKQLLILNLLLTFIGYNCGWAQSNTSIETQLYQQAILNARFPAGDKIDTNLIAIPYNNDPFMVVSWIDAGSAKYYRDFTGPMIRYKTPIGHPIWVTIARDLKSRMMHERNGSLAETTLRLEQLLGLPPHSGYDSFVVFWVTYADLFRPCPDSEVNDRRCELCFPVNASKEHKAWINQTRGASYFNSCDPTQNYPWTQLGYTYDWNPSNKSHVGLSEFVLHEEVQVIVKGIYSTDEYLNRAP